MKPTVIINRLVATPATVAASERYDRNVEGKIQRTIVQWLESRGVFVAESRTNKRTTSKPGTPDLMFCYKGVPFALEIKRPGKKPEGEQPRVIAQMRDNGWKTGWFDNDGEALLFIRENI